MVDGKQEVVAEVRTEEQETHFYEGKTVLVTGGTGFVGDYIVQELLKRGASVRVPIHKRPLRIRDERICTMQADLTKVEDCRAAAKGIDYVFHAAGAVGAAAVTPISLMEAITMNLTLTAQMLRAGWVEDVKRLLLFSSSTVYPVTSHAVKEEEAWNGSPHPAYLGYGWMRRYLEKLGGFVVANSNVKIAVVRPTAVYGRWDNFDPATSHVIPALIRKAVERQDPYEVWGNGEEARDFLHAADLARGSLLALERYATCEPINVGYGKATTIKEIVFMILNAARYDKAKVVFNASRPTSIPFRLVDISKAERVLGFKPEVPLEKGLSDTVRWYAQMRLEKPSPKIDEW